MNGYDLTARWFEYADENPEWVDTNVTALYFAIIQRSNELRWKTKFQLPTLDTMQRIGIRSPKTYYPALEKLENAGFITMLERSKNQYTACIIQLNAEVNFTEATAEATTEAKDKQGISNSLGDALARETNTNKKTIQTEETNKQEIAPVDNSFDEFWDAYDKKEDRKKCEDKWNKLPEPTRRKILEHVPAYVRLKPEVQFRKNPLTYLNGEVWKDPLTPSSSATQKQMVY